jgi:hypothetical protein
LSFLDGLDSKTLGKLPELDDESLPVTDSSVPDLESFVDLMDEVKKVEEPSKPPVTAVFKPVSTAPTTVAVVKASAKITPIIITEIKHAVNTTPKSTPRIKVLYYLCVCLASLWSIPFYFCISSMLYKSFQCHFTSRKW